MLQNLKLILLSIAFFFIGGISYFAWSNFSQTQQDLDDMNLQGLSETSETPDETQEVAEIKKAETSATSTPKTKDEEPQTGTILGSLGYPSSIIPPLAIYAYKVGDFSTYFTLETKLNQQTFTMESIAPGTYVVVAYPLDMPGLAGGYTKAVACGLSVECEDHSLVPVVVAGGKSAVEVEVKDWYAPEGTFPKRP